MIENMTFADVVSEVDAAEEGFTSKGLDKYFDIMEWLANGGTVYDVPNTSHDEAVVLLAVGWKQVRDMVLSYEG